MNKQDIFNFAVISTVCTVFITSLIMLLLIVAVFVYDSSKASEESINVQQQIKNERMIQ